MLIEELSRSMLRRAIEEVRAEYPFEIEAFVLLPDHLHAIWVLPKDDTDFSTRWRIIKSKFSRYYLGQGGDDGQRNPSRQMKGEHGIWQRRFWEHQVRSEEEFEILCNYIHYNPVKHGYAKCPHGWAYSSFGRNVQMRRYANDWNCLCGVEGKRDVPEVDGGITGE